MSARAWAAFATVSTLWGIPYLFIKIAVDDGVPPAFLAFVRVALGAAVLIGAGLAGRHAGHPARARALAGASTRCSRSRCPSRSSRRASSHVASSLAAIIIAAVPIFVALLALRFDPAERATRFAPRRASSSGWPASWRWSASTSPGAATSCWPPARSCVAAVGYAAGPMVFKRTLADLDPRAAMGASLAVAAVALAPLAAVDPPGAVPSAQALVALVVLGHLLHRGGVRLLRRAHRRGRPRARARHHLRRARSSR